MSPFEAQPKGSGEEERPLSLETPEDEADRLARLKKASESVPGESVEGTQDFLASQEKAADAALANERVREEAALAYQRDEEQAREVLKGIQSKEVPVPAGPQSERPSLGQTHSEEISSPKPRKTFLQRLKFWEREKQTAAELFETTKPGMAKDIERGDIASARAAFSEFSKKVKDKEEEVILRAKFERMISSQIETLAQANDTEKMKMIVENNTADTIGPKNLALMPQEIIQSPGVQLELTANIEQTFSGNREYGVKKANEYVELGLMSRESVQALLQSEAFQSKLAEDIDRTFSGNREYGLKKASEYVELGLMSRESVQALLQSEAFQKKLTQDIEQAFSGNREVGLRKASEYVKLGLMSRERASQLLSFLQAK